ncbi:hypothetical protein IV203_037596 [Nitzschia inconspicua]|uniref:Uncharacterized protein n=1 Tax=Nitzschia inconspicua TaxID=303405 RepID=A0A9K3Q141_9STRA|nr:hypothetical protein IV203_037596 [Nitzschia inconspicua]
MSGLDGHHDNHAEINRGEGHPFSPPKPKCRRSMDLEFHDLDLNDLDESEHSKSKKVNGTGLLRIDFYLGHSGGDDSSSFNDSFGEASDDEEPDKQYLEELLDEEYHPERLNLLDSNSLPRKDKPKLQRSLGKNGFMGVKYDVSDSDSEPERPENTTEDEESDWTPSRSGAHTDSSSDLQEEDCVYDQSDHTYNVDSILPQNDDWDSSYERGETITLDDEPNPGEEDVFESSPKRRTESARPSIKEQMERMGSSTKKSFRTVGNRPFFSQPFKSLTKTLSGGKRKPRKGLEQQEVA